MFDHWELDSIDVGSVNPYNVTMNESHNLHAGFAQVPPPPSISVSIAPMSASIFTGQSIHFTSQVTGDTSPYTLQWYLENNPVTGATSSSWAFTPSQSWVYYVCLKVIDPNNASVLSQSARIVVAVIPVGGYAVSVQGRSCESRVCPEALRADLPTHARRALW